MQKPGGIPLSGELLKRESGDPAYAGNSGAVPAAVNPGISFLKSPCHCSAASGWEGFRKTGEPEDLPANQNKFELREKVRELALQFLTFFQFLKFYWHHEK